MRSKCSLPAAALLLATILVGAQRVAAVELLVSGNFEPPGGLSGEVPGWNLQEFLTGSAASANTAEVTGGADPQLFLRAFEGGGPLHPAQGNFNDDGLPAGNVDGADLLIWQRYNGLTGSALPAQGDATGDMNVNGSDLNTWESNFGSTQKYANARLSQVVPAAAGETYTFQGSSTFEENYSGFVTTLGDASPFGQIASPTTTKFRMEFLDNNNLPIGAPTELNLRTDQTFPGFPIFDTPLIATAPGGTVNLRVTAEALDMAWNGTQASAGALQSAYFNDFSLHNGTNPGTDLLVNGNLNLGTPDALDFWNQQEIPATRDEILRTINFANHTPGGAKGVWLSAFFGAHPSYEPNPVDGTISQTVTAVAGGSYTFSGWTRFEANYSGGVDTISSASPGAFKGLSSPTVTEIRLDFMDINSVVIGSSIIDVKAARRLLSPSGNANDNLWYQHTLMATAPANTRFAKLTARMFHGVFNVDPGQSAFFDDFSLLGPSGLISVPEPSSLASLAIGAALVGLRRRRAAAILPLV